MIATTHYGYDEWGNVAAILTLDAEEEVISNFGYEWDLVGQLLSKLEYQAKLDLLPREYTYTYDAQGQLTGDGTETWDWDLNGNPDGATIDPGNQLRENASWVFTYDDEGNMTGKEEVGGDLKWSYYFNHANQLVKVERRTNGTDVDLEVDFKYDPYGNRVEKAVDPDGIGVDTVQVRRFALDGWNTSKWSPIGNENWDVLADLDGGGSLITRYLRGDVVDQLFARVAGGDSFWVLSDNLGSIRDVLDGTGALAKSVAYGAFGEIADQAGIGEFGRYGWTGREIDEEIGLQYNRARYYDWSIGRWISQDPIGFEAGDSNLYRYVKNEPVQSGDPSGLIEFLTEGKGPDLNLAMEVSYQIIGRDGKRLSKADIENDPKSFGKNKFFVDNINNFFNDQINRQGLVKLSSPAFKGHYIPILRAILAEDTVKETDHIIRLADYPSLGDVVNVLNIKLSEERIKKDFKFDPTLINIKTSLGAQAFFNKDKQLEVKLHHFPAFEKFAIDVLGIKASEVDTEFSLAGKVIRKVPATKGPFLPTRYFSKWEAFLMEKIPMGKFKLIREPEKDPNIKLFFESIFMFNK